MNDATKQSQIALIKEKLLKIEFNGFLLKKYHKPIIVIHFLQNEWDAKFNLQTFINCTFRSPTIYKMYMEPPMAESNSHLTGFYLFL